MKSKVESKTTLTITLDDEEIEALKVLLSDTYNSERSVYPKLYFKLFGELYNTLKDIDNNSSEYCTVEELVEANLDGDLKYV